MSLNKVEFLLLYANTNKEVILTLIKVLYVLSKEAMMNKDTINNITIDIDKENSSYWINEIAGIKFRIIEINLMIY